MKKTIIFLILITIFFTGCNNKEITNKYYSFIDSNGEVIILTSKPKNVAVLFSSFVEIYNNAGGTVNITVKESVDRKLVSEDTILVDTGSGKVINNELLIASKPDFVIASLDISEQVKTAKLLNNLGIPCALFKVETFEDYLFTLDILTDITGNKTLYKTYGEDIQENINNIKEKIKIDNVPKILFIRSGSSATSCKAKNTDSHFACKILFDLGTENIADKAPILLDGLSIEEIILNEPDYIFISIMGNEDSGKAFMQELLNSKPYSSLKAIKNNNYYFLPKELFQYKPNHRWDKAYQYMVDIIYE